ncbi:hypothetical protein BMS3Bbin02_01423 [bacterium BMS3Bbin02]|nr:hypothetical protein BMS3Bbin02_01423 [bacterium BMS3Bbin02]
MPTTNGHIGIFLVGRKCRGTSSQRGSVNSGGAVIGPSCYRVFSGTGYNDAPGRTNVPQRRTHKRYAPGAQRTFEIGHSSRRLNACHEYPIPLS